MKDMLAIIIRTILAIAAIFVIIIVFAVSTNSSELEKAELKENEEIKKIKVIEFKKNFSTGTWKCEIEINGRYNITLKEDELGGEIRTSLYNANEIRINKEKVNRINNVEIEYL